MKRRDFIKARVGGEVGRALDHDHLRVIRERGVGLPSLLEPSDEGRVDGRLATLEVEPRQERDAGELPGVQMRLRPRRRT